MQNNRVFQAIDLDRTLFDTKKLEEVSYSLIGELHPEVAQLAYQTSSEHIAAGSSFFIFQFLRDNLTTAEYDAFITEMKESTSPDDFLLEHAMERVAFASSKDEWSGGILTYGKEQDQFLKLELCGLDTYPWLIAETPDKGTIISEWRQDDGSFMLPPAFGERPVDVVTLDDDKPEAFRNLPQGAIGVLVVGKSVTLAQGIPDFTQPVGVVANLEESIAYLEPLL